jgi:hypothetical protein
MTYRIREFPTPEVMAKGAADQKEAADQKPYWEEGASLGEGLTNAKATAKRHQGQARNPLGEISQSFRLVETDEGCLK